MRNLVLATFLVLPVAAGCGGSDDGTQTIRTPDGSVEMSGKGDDFKAVTKTEDGEVVTEMKDGEFTVTSEKGAFKMGSKGKLEDLGIASYPGARLAEDGGFMTFEAEGSRQVTAQLVTDAPLEKVVAFYEEQIGAKAAVLTTGDEATLTGETADGTIVSVQVSKHDGGGNAIVVTTVRKR